MNKIDTYLEKYKVGNTKAPPHWKADIVNLIIELIGLDPQFTKWSPAEQYRKTFGKWLGMVKRSRKSWGDCMDVLKKAQGLPSKYNKAGYIVNQLKAPKTQKLL